MHIPAKSLIGALLLASGLSVQAVPIVTLTRDQVQLDRFISATGDQLIPPTEFQATYSGPFYSGPGASVDIGLNAYVTYYTEPPFTDYGYFVTTSSIRHTPGYSNRVAGHASAAALLGGPFQWYGKSNVQMNWEFMVTGEAFNLSLFAEGEGQGEAGFSLFDLTNNISIRSFDSLHPSHHEYFEASLLAGHSYQLTGYARAETVAGDPMARFQFDFGAATIVPAPAPEGGSSLLCLGLALGVLETFRRSRRKG